jgi:hypothetical protein
MLPSVTKLTVPALAMAVAVALSGCGEDEGDAEACRMPFTEYSGGSSVAGLELEARLPRCGRRPSVGYVYGTCEPSGDSGCAPPLEIQSWSARHRKPSRSSDGNTRELRRGEVTVVIFAHSERVAAAAERALQPAEQ